MDVPETVKEAAAGATEGLKKGGKRGLRHIIEEIMELGALATGGAGTSLLLRHKELKEAREQAKKLRTEGKHEEATNFLETALSRFTLVDETAVFKTLPRVVKHFNRLGQQDKADQLLDTFLALDEVGLNRFREILLRCGNEDAQFRKLVEWGEAFADQQDKMIKLAEVSHPPEHQPGHVLAEEMRRVGTSLRDKSNANVERIKQEIKNKRRARRTTRP